MRVVFLDFDGVVVCLPTVKGKLGNGRTVRDANPEPVAHLNAVLKETGAVVVVSSTWRLHSPVEHLRGTLERAGFTGEVVDVTPDLDAQHPTSGLWMRKERGYEIKAWLDAHPDVMSYVVLDDDNDCGPIPEARWVLVKGGWFYGGFRAAHARRAIAMLKQPMGLAELAEHDLGGEG